MSDWRGGATSDRWILWMTPFTSTEYLLAQIRIKSMVLIIISPVRIVLLSSKSIHDVCVVICECLWVFFVGSFYSRLEDITFLDCFSTYPLTSVFFCILYSFGNRFSVTAGPLIQAHIILWYKRLTKTVVLAVRNSLWVSVGFILSSSSPLRSPDTAGVTANSSTLSAIHGTCQRVHHPTFEMWVALDEICTWWERCGVEGSHTGLS